MNFTLRPELLALLEEYETTQDVDGLVAKHEQIIKEKFYLLIEERLGG